VILPRDGNANLAFPSAMKQKALNSNPINFQSTSNGRTEWNEMSCGIKKK
jgi:hypothetical protein